MNFIDFFQKQIEKYNNEQKCDFCWFFSAPLEESAINIQQLRDDSKCCVQVMFTQNEGNAFGVQNQYDNRSSLLTDSFCSENFNLFFLIPNRLGQNNYNEIDGHGIEESRSAELMRLKDCISCDLNLDFCEFLGMNFQITQWSGRQFLNYQDNNYIGYKVSVTLRKRI